LAPAYAGHHDSMEAQNAADWVVEQEFGPHNVTALFNNDRGHHHFGVFA
jgi:hypothetical protein